MANLQKKMWGEIQIDERSKGWRIVPAFLKRFLHAFVRYFPLVPSWRAAMHRWRGVNVGKNVFIGAEVFIDDATPHLVYLKDNVTVIARASILGHAYYPKHFGAVLGNKKAIKPTVIGKGAYLGFGATLLPGVEIGEYAVVGAGSVVTKDVPAYSVAVGVPARVIKTFKAENLS